MIGYRARSLALLLAGLTAFACKEKDPPIAPLGPTEEPIPVERLPETGANFSETTCKSRINGHAMQCGTIRVPESPGSSREIELRVVRVFSDQEKVEPEPVIYLDGGPGAESLASVVNIYRALSAAAPDRDFIFFDQRGVGTSEPVLTCGEENEVEEVGEALDLCFERLSKTADLDAYNSRNNAADVDAIRAALGYERLNLYGISYGTRLGLTVMRDYPEGVRAALLDSVVALQVDLLGRVGLSGYEAFVAVFDACAADEQCQEKYPNSLEQLTTLVTQLNDEPQEVGGYPLDGDTVTAVIFNLLYSPELIAFVPALINTLSEGDFSLFEDLEPAAAGGGISFGMHLSLHCSEEVPFTSRQEIESFDEQVAEALRPGLTGIKYLEYCEHWPVAQAPDSENEAAESAVPSLVLAGKFDPITPPSFAEAAFAHLENSQYFMLEGESHGASVGPCGARLAKAFFKDPSAQLDSSCLGEELAPEFLSQGAKNSSSAHVVPTKIKMKSAPPTAEELERGLEDLKKRLR